jgi:hypothetical protein
MPAKGVSMANPRQQSPIPEVYVLWHPGCEIGEFLARRIYAWLRPGNGLGPQVFYRSTTAPGGPAGGLPLSLPGESRGMPVSGTDRAKVSNVQIVLLLIDAHMVADPAWRFWLTALASPSNTSVRRVFMPIALEASAYNVPASIRDLNFLRPASLPKPGIAENAAEVVESKARSLLKQLTEALCRFMLSGRQTAGQNPDDDVVVPKLKVFLSHAKADGTGPARRIRDYIYSQTQLAAFYDENDIAFGSAFASVLKKDLTANETAALIAVRTQRYATRPWCRREVTLFRRPRTDPLPGLAQERWILQPTVVVDALEPGRQTLGIPELGNTSCIRWDDASLEQEEQIVTTLMRDVMLAAFHAAVGATIPAQPQQIIINWLPDPSTMLRIPSVQAHTPMSVFHPGRSLSGLELATFLDLFPHLTFRSFEETLT